MLLLWSPAFAKDELANWGGWWRNRYREQPAKAQRLIAELRGMIREGRVSGNPGAAAVDLWGVSLVKQTAKTPSREGREGRTESSFFFPSSRLRCSFP